MKYLLLFSLLSLQVNASILPKGKKFFYSDYSYSTSTSLWARGSERTDYRGTDLAGEVDDIAERIYQQVGARLYYGYSERIQLGAGLRYGQVELKKAKFFFADEGESRSQISEIFLEGIYNVSRKENSSLNFGIRFLHPGEKTIQQPEFLSFNDFTDYLELEISHIISFTRIDINSKAKYRHTLTDQGNNHYILEESILYKLDQKSSIGFGADILETDQGLDVVGDEFNEIVADSGDVPVWNKDESWLGLAILGTYILDYKYQLNGYIHQKVQGRNTDAATTVGFGWGMVLD